MRRGIFEHSVEQPRFHIALMDGVNFARHALPQQRAIGKVSFVKRGVGEIHALHLRAAHIGFGQIGFQKIDVVERRAEKVRLLKMRVRKITVIKKSADKLRARQNFMRKIELMPGLQRQIETLSARDSSKILFMQFEKFGDFILQHDSHRGR